MRTLRSNSGFTLLEMVVAGGILSFLMLGFSSYMFYQNRSNKNQEIRQNANNLEKMVVRAAGEPDELLRTENMSK